MSWRDSDQTFLKGRAWRLWWLVPALVLVGIVVSAVVSAFVPSASWVAIALFAASLFGVPNAILLRSWSGRKEVIETGCVWCLYPSVSDRARCPECGNITTTANRAVAKHFLKHGTPP